MNQKRSLFQPLLVLLPFLLLGLAPPPTQASCSCLPDAESQGDLRAIDLRTEYRVDPLGIDTPAPRLSWVLAPVHPELRNLAQQAYQIQVGSSPDQLASEEPDLWDSGRVASTQNLHVVYDGVPLGSGQTVFWRVRVWDGEKGQSAWSEVATLEMALLHPEDWEGTWIKGVRPLPESEMAWYENNPAPLLRKSFSTNGKRVRKARVYVTGLGYYELSLNGERVGDHVLDPAWTAYDKRVLYSVYDVTAALNDGENVLGMMLGNGWYNPLPLKIFRRWQLREILPVGAPKAILQLNVEYEDGSRQTVVTDTSWKTADGPIRKNNIYLGEIYDAREEIPGWNRPGFDAEGWPNALRATAPKGELTVQDLPPIRVKRRIRPVEIVEQKPGVFIFDMGQNFAGWITLRVEGVRGDTVSLRFAERLHEDGNIDVLTSTMTQIKDWEAIEERDWERVLSAPHWDEGAVIPETVWQADTYVLKGRGPEEYTPRFTWHGFRFVEVRGYPGTPTLDALEGYLLHSDTDPAGSFVSSNPLFNETQEITLWSMLSNMFSVQSDCPHRERFGYGGDIVAADEMAIFNLDMSRFYAKTVHDFADAVRPNGGLTEIAPHVGIQSEGLGGGSGPVGWGTAHPELVWRLYQYYGDRRLLEGQYDAIRHWVDFLETRAVDGILDNGISDHESLAPKPKALTGTAFYYYNTWLLVRFAEILGNSRDAATYGERAEDIKTAFQRRFLKPSGDVGMGTQASQAFALYFGLVPDSLRPAVMGRLVRNLEKHDLHLDTGIFGTRYLFNALTDHGRADLAYAVANQRTFPSYGHMIENGATTLWESWTEPTQASHNHPMFGSVSEWYYKALLGIRPVDGANGFDRFELRPEIVGDLKWVRGHYDSVRGRIRSDWMRVGDTLVYRTTVPPGTRATLYLPAADRTDVLEGGVPAHTAPGISYLRTDDGSVVYELGSGSYRFEAKASLD